MSMYPFYRVYDESGEQYCDCGWEKHAQELIILNKDVQKLTYKKINAPILDQTIDIAATGIAELPGQQGLPKAKERLPFEPEVEQLPESELYHIEL
tara:strand:- start:395 stop:682 length:288 start_codon:yes stop_codon:yes gene_type:complete